MHSLMKRALASLWFVEDISFGDTESGEFVDGANLGEMDCCWSPSMGMPPADFENTRPHGMALNVPSVR